MYLKTYYDGYGYNFYYGEYSYYEDSPNGPKEGNMNTVLGITITAIIIFCYACGKLVGSAADPKTQNVRRDIPDDSSSQSQIELETE